MTQKEKAKAYDEALKKASAAHKDEDGHLKTTSERIFPELKESDDEKIKAAILNHLKIMWGNCQDDVCGVHVWDAITWLEKQGEQASLQTNERTWLYLVSDVLTWRDGIGQYLDDPRVQEFAKKLCSEYTQKLYNPSSKFKLKKERFDPKTLKPFDKILVRRGNENYDAWFPDFVSDPPNNTINTTFCMCIKENILMVIPYNDDTKHLVGTSDKAPEFYRYWED